MARLKPLTHAQADERQRALWDSIVQSRGQALDLTTPDGRLAGPFEAFVRRPELGEHLIQVGAVVRFGSSLAPRLLELAITTVGARWQSEFEFWAHSQLALAAGLDPAVVDDLAAGVEPNFSDPNEQAVYDYTIALCSNGKVAQPIYDAAINAIGEDNVIVLTHTIGYYSHISFLLNAFDVDLPAGVEARFD